MLVEEKSIVIKIKTIAEEFCAGSCPGISAGVAGSLMCSLFMSESNGNKYCTSLEINRATGLAIRCSKCVEAKTP